jgi:hypothetical protein
MCEALIKEIVIIADDAVRPIFKISLAGNNEGLTLNGPALPDKQAVRALPNYGGATPPLLELPGPRRTAARCAAPHRAERSRRRTGLSEPKACGHGRQTTAECLAFDGVAAIHGRIQTAFAQLTALWSP